ncbi:MAG TPA: hypothetical protein VEF04_09620, partial [Blastocatellia bacterium]|nr:hypothetical protein [Blastocatellia bacterium]
FFGAELNLSDESVKELKPFLIETKRPVSTINLHGTRDLLSLVPSWRSRLMYCLGFILPNQSYYEGSSWINAFIKHSIYRLNRATHWLLNKRDDQRTTAN